jgi:hypothetical protein
MMTASSTNSEQILSLTKRNEKSLKLQLTTDQDRVTVNEIPKTRNCFRTVHRQRLNQVEPNFKKGYQKISKNGLLATIYQTLPK